MNLTERQNQIMNIVCSGLENKEIANRLQVAESTIRNTRVSIYERLEAKNASEAVYKFTLRNVECQMTNS